MGDALGTFGHGRMTFLKQTLSRTLSYIFSERFRGVVLTDKHPAHLARHRLDTVFSRIRLVSLMFGVLTVCWIPIDVVTLDARSWMILGALRLLVAGVFFALAGLPEKDVTHGAALALVALMMANPLVLHATAEVLLSDAPLQGMALVNANLYAALPFVIMAGLSLFPLVALESLLLAAPLFVLAALIPALSGSFSWVEVISHGWVLGLLLGICMLAGMIQVFYMEALLHRAHHDPLTGALTRRSGTEVVEFMFRLASDKSAPLAVAFLDIDNFKSINDGFGHEAGDEALRKTVKALKSELRDADTIVRWGGEEFVLLLGDTAVDGARVVIDRIMEKWLGERPDGGPLTASIGVAERLSDHANTWDDLIQLADQRMYEAKRAGKARTIFGPTLTVAA